MNKGVKIGIIILIIIAVIGSILFILFKPSYELNKAVEYLKNGNYKEAYAYVKAKGNEENITIIKELITSIFCNRASSGIERVGNIATQCTNVVRKVDLTDIDYTLDDNINIDVQSLERYIALEDEISKDMIAEELAETYDLYFNILKYVNENFYNVLNRINDDEFIDNVNSLASDMTKISNDCYAYSDNHNLNPKTVDLYEEINKYIV